MTNLNHVVLIGNLVRDCGSSENDFGYTSNGQARANITIAVNRSKKQGEEWVDETSFFDITVWGKTAENLKPYFTKGSKIAVEGYLKQDRWEKDGQKHSRISIVAEHVELCGGRKEGGNTNGNPVANPVPFNASQDAMARAEPVVGGDSFPEDIPF